MHMQTQMIVEVYEGSIAKASWHESMSFYIMLVTYVLDRVD